MRILKSTIRTMLITSCLSLLLPVAAHAAPGPGEALPPQNHAAQMTPNLPEAREMGRGLDEGMLPLPEFMHGLDLSEAQRDDVFEIMHDQMPLARQKQKAIRSAQNELRRLAMSNQYEEAKARSLAESMAKNVMELTLLRARTNQMLYALLDTAQRRQVLSLSSRTEFDGAPAPRPGFPPEANRPAPH